LNGHCRTLLEGWGGNCDFTILIDFDATLNYVAKYGTKKENSAGFQSVFHTALRKGIQNESEVKTVLRSVFLKVTSGREKTQQETAHLIMGLPLVRCSEWCYAQLNPKLLHFQSQWCVVFPTAIFLEGDVDLFATHSSLKFKIYDTR